MRNVPMSRMLRALSLVLMLALVAGCMPDLTSERPPERIYWLEAAIIDDPPPVRLAVDVVPGLDSDRIWLLEEDQRLNFYAGAHWPDSLQPLLQSLIARSLNASARGPDLQVLIERFFSVSRGEGLPPGIELTATFRSSAGLCRFQRARSAASGRLRDIVAGHQLLLNDLIEALAAFGRSGRCP